MSPLLIVIDYGLTQDVETTSVELLRLTVALKSCSFARALTWQILFLVLKECPIVAGGFYTGTCTENCGR